MPSFSFKVYTDNNFNNLTDTEFAETFGIQKHKDYQRRVKIIFTDILETYKFYDIRQKEESEEYEEIKQKLLIFIFEILNGVLIEYAFDYMSGRLKDKEKITDSEIYSLLEIVNINNYTQEDEDIQRISIPKRKAFINFLAPRLDSIGYIGDINKEYSEGQKAAYDNADKIVLNFKHLTTDNLTKKLVHYLIRYYNMAKIN